MLSFLDDAVTETVNIGKFIKEFTLMFFLGNLLTFSSFILVPGFLLIFPQLISLLLNAGILLILCSFALIKGGIWKYFFSYLLCEGSFLKRFFTLCLYSAMALNLYSALIRFNTLESLFSMLLEYVALLYFMCSSFPGGVSGVNLMCGFLRKLICPCWDKWRFEYLILSCWYFV